MRIDHPGLHTKAGVDGVHQYDASGRLAFISAKAMDALVENILADSIYTQSYQAKYRPQTWRQRLKFKIQWTWWVAMIWIHDALFSRYCDHGSC